LNTPTSSTDPLPDGYFATGAFYTGMVQSSGDNVITPTEAVLRKTECVLLSECKCGSWLGCAIAANGNVELFFELLAKYPISFILLFSFTDPPFKNE
jgi:hypothetical protein